MSNKSPYIARNVANNKNCGANVKCVTANKKIVGSIDIPLHKKKPKGVRTHGQVLLMYFLYQHYHKHYHQHTQ